MKKSIMKRIGVCLTVAVMMVSCVACNTKIKVTYECNASDYVKLGQYKGITVSVDTASIENGLIEKRIKSDLDSNTTYSETSRAAINTDQVTVDFTATIGGEDVSGFSDSNYSIILGKDTFKVDGFIDALIGMKAGDKKVVTLTVPQNFTDEPEYSGRKIVFNITMDKVEQENVPMITDAYVKEKFSCDTVADYRNKVKGEVQSAIDEQVSSAKQQAVLTKLQDNCEVLGYPEDYLASRTSDFSTSINFYAAAQGLSNDDYCQKKFGLSFDDYVKKAVVQDLVLQLIVQQEGLSITEYEYKGDLADFAKSMGYTDKDAFETKFGKDKIVRNMLLQKAQDIVMNSAVYQ